MQPLTKEFYTRFNLMNGKLELPGMAVFKEAIGSEYTSLAEHMFQAMWHSYLKNKGTISLPYWSSKFDNPKVFNQVIMSLSKAGWIDSTAIPARNWAEASLNEDKLLEIVDSNELEQIRAFHKMQKYVLTDEAPRTHDRVKRNGKTVRTGLKRPGFKAAGETEWTFDKAMMIEYYDVILAQLTKSMDKIILDYPELLDDGASYREISAQLLDYYLESEETYKLGENISDARGRAIYQILRKVFNPIQNKEARALIVLPEEFLLATTQDTLDNYYLFIAEMHGFKSGTVQAKKDAGLRHYINYDLLDLNWDSESDRKEIYENIWMERIYKELDTFFRIDTGIINSINRKRVQAEYTPENVAELLSNPNWDHRFAVPIEIDASASVLQYLGILLNHKPFMERTNLIGDVLSDAWTIKGINSRAQVKVIMRTIYGSNQQCWEMWENEGIDYTTEDIARYNKELSEGSLAVAELFKDFLIQNANPKKLMDVQIWKDYFEIECNRFRQVGEKTISYDIYDTMTDLIKRIHHTTTKSVEDFEQFRRYFVTLLIHNLDSQGADRVCLYIMELFGWCIPIHDAWILHPSAATEARKEYARFMEELYENRTKILQQYFNSIGISNAAQQQWKAVQAAVIPLTTPFKCNLLALK